MEEGDFEDQSIGLSVTQDELAKRLGVSRVSIARWESGARALPPEAIATLLAMQRDRDNPVVEPEPEIQAVVPELVSSDWRTMTREERMKLPPGSDGWVYRRGAALPKGQWVEVLDEPERTLSGALITQIKWCSNGVGSPSMQLIGTTKDALTYERDGFSGLAPGVYSPAVPNTGNKEFMAKQEKSR